MQQKTPATFGVLKILAYHNAVGKSKKLLPCNYSYPLYLLNTEKLNKTDSKKKNYQSLRNKNFEDQYLMTSQRVFNQYN